MPTTDKTGHPYSPPRPLAGLLGDDPDKLPALAPGAKVELPREALALAPCAAQDKTRYAMHGLRVEAGSETVRVMATDGKALVCVDYARSDVRSESGRDIDPDARGVAVVPLKACVVAAKASKQRKGEPLEARTVVLDTGATPAAARLETAGKDGATTVAAPLVDGYFPPVYDTSVVGNSGAPGRVVIGLNADLLARVARALHEGSGLDAREDAIVYLSVAVDPDTAARSAIYVAVPPTQGRGYGTGATRALGIVMPVVLDRDAAARAFAPPKAEIA